jgi:hypothetical protein
MVRRMASPQVKYERWLAWRKKTVEENFPDVCTCYIYKPFAKQSSCKNCEMCPGCEQHIKNECWAAHEKVCRALKDLEGKHATQN